MSRHCKVYTYLHQFQFQELMISVGLVVKKIVAIVQCTCQQHQDHACDIHCMRFFTSYSGTNTDHTHQH